MRIIFFYSICFPRSAGFSNPAAQNLKLIIHFFNFNPKLFFGDGYQGNTSYSPYDKILVTCGAPEIPNELKKQLKIGGIMVIPVGEGIEQKMLKIKKINEDEYNVREYGTFKFVPMVERTVK